ncbi:MAG: hypothetical protein K6F50_05735 [Kiritimatiellae bacterium]|nr:hypothetical protein [Kiritimatiellia bacterium]
MSRIPHCAILAALSLLCAGCATVRYTDQGGKPMVEVTNRGWYLFNLIPLASGNPDLPNECDFRLFKQTTTLENNVRMLDWAATKYHATGIRDVSSYMRDESVFFILLKRHAIHTSAELVIPRKDGSTCASQDR